MLSVTAMLVAGAALMGGETWAALLQVCVLGCAAVCAVSHNSICACACRAELLTCLPGPDRPPPWLHASWLPRRLPQGKTLPPLQEVGSCLHTCPKMLLSTLAVVLSEAAASSHVDSQDVSQEGTLGCLARHSVPGDHVMHIQVL